MKPTPTGNTILIGIFETFITDLSAAIEVGENSVRDMVGETTLDPQALYNEAAILAGKKGLLRSVKAVSNNTEIISTDDLIGWIKTMIYDDIGYAGVAPVREIVTSDSDLKMAMVRRLMVHLQERANGDMLKIATACEELVESFLNMYGSESVHSDSKCDDIINGHADQLKRMFP